MMQSFDVVIVGGGMVGLAAAAAMAKEDMRIAVIEKQRPSSNFDPLPDVRVSALSRASEQILRKLDAWQGIEQRRFTPYSGMHVWELDSFAQIDFDAQSLCQPNLGHIVENRVIQLSLWEQVESLANVTIFESQLCQSLSIGESEAWLMLDSGVGITAKLVVGADGANSWLRQQVDIPLTHWDYGHSAIVANIRCDVPHENVARQVFTPQGPIALLPLNEPDLCSLVWSIDPTEAERLTTLSEAEFNKALYTEFDGKLGLLSVEGDRQAFPLRMRYARDFALERVALIGDAAHTIHPLAGQGVNLGLLDAAGLAQHVIALWQSGQDIGSKRNLRPFERWRKAEAAKMIAAMQGFKDLFAGGNPIKKLIRGVGVTLVDKLPGAKQQIMMRALGLEGSLPNLAKR
ncbi:FAD-dependent 2-octaprenylphenol hydroxylase [Vibrio sp. SCSIO 43136]|uniref:FAD-dependent 2-octaprenylphenol hydroxylase n=1 Tax=Vibrio sp. SCSIO 43136 TaxID=2819101 RepID=UPI0020759B65|nr:FAD-dependent 2-octaprenylphenol hydroxylase [Vibrio sp. SCSIO 43136]USD65643.1 FAD-dependent 2-octaprenylphenol hydroxylase [Vibrio sp. SCSIO 43136]